MPINPGNSSNSESKSTSDKSNSLNIFTNSFNEERADIFDRIYDYFAKKKGRVIPVESERIVLLNNPETNLLKCYAGNKISTAKYTKFSFLPKNLFSQFSRVANSYFLFLLLLHAIPNVAGVNPMTTALPLVLVLGITAAKDGFDDWKRQNCDRVVNSRPASVLRSIDGEISITLIPWEEVAVGDIVEMKDNEFVAADIMLLSSSELDGMCYIETAELDGETNLKLRQAPSDTSFFVKPVELARLRGAVRCETPNNNLNVFDGTLDLVKNYTIPTARSGVETKDSSLHPSLESSPSITSINTTRISINNSNVLLRGCVLRNTAWVFGIVVFAGHDTKLMQNSRGARFKRTQIDRVTNSLVVSIFFFLALSCLIAAIFAGVWDSNNESTSQFYIGDLTSSPGKVAFKQFVSFVILLNTLVPISLYVSVEVIRLGQSMLIDWDIQMYDEVSNTTAHALTTTLNEELGQIEYIFSDKTGTLTQNVMRFMKCSIFGIKYGYGVTEAAAVAYGLSSRKELENTVIMDKSKENPYWESNFHFVDGNDESNSSNRNDIPRTSLSSQLNFESNVAHNMENISLSPDADTVPYIPEDNDKQSLLSSQLPDGRVVDFFLALAICHTVTSIISDDGEIEYKAQSPDEAALVSAARNFGIVFLSRQQSKIFVVVLGKKYTFQLLKILDFDSDRKRMSVLVKYPNDEIRILCKGADVVIFSLLRECTHNSELLKETSLQHMHEYATEGLRTLCLATRVISHKEYEEWEGKYEGAVTSLTDRRKKLRAVSELIECNLLLQGSTAVEDKLQDGVSSTISNLKAAGIKIWVLTGDKQETAINIGYACSLLVNESDVIIVNGKRACEVQSQLTAHLSSWDNESPRSLVIDGCSLLFALSPEMADPFLEVCFQCNVVICCRVSPLQKALVVSLVKKKVNAVTLAIGDGANDVSMIQTAHIGIGVTGFEGRQAVLAADYSLPQFRFLERFLLVHGRWSYNRMCRFLVYFFYKNFAFTLVQFWFAIYSGWSGTTVYDQWFISSYNVMFTSLPVMALGVFEQDVSEKACIRYPNLYQAGQLNLNFNKGIFGLSLALGIWTSIVMYFVPVYALFEWTGSLDSSMNGQDLSGLHVIGTVISCSLVLVVNVQMAIHTQHWTYISILLILLSIVSWWMFSLTLHALTIYDYYWVIYSIGNQPKFWLTVIITAAIALLPVFIIRYVQVTYFPTPIDIVREMAALNIESIDDSEVDREIQPTRNSLLNIVNSNDSNNTGYAFAQSEGWGSVISRLFSDRDDNLEDVGISE